MIKLLAVSIFLLCTNLSFAQQHSKCKVSDSKSFYVLNSLEIKKGNLSATEVDINARNKTVCAVDVLRMIDEGFFTLAIFETIQCMQFSDADRLAAARLTNDGYKIIGKISSVSSRKITLKDCSFEPL